MNAENLCVVLVRAENPANIGQTARAIRNFGFSNLALVRSAPHRVDEAYTLGWHAKDILDRAPAYESLEEALCGSALVVGLTHRSGRERGEPRSIVEVTGRVVEVMNEQKVSLVFGNEKNGLSNEELACCHELAFIPTGTEHSSLNLSHAVAVTLFSIFTRCLTFAAGNSRDRSLPHRKPERFYATPGEFGELIENFREVFDLLGYDESPKEDLLERTLENVERFFHKTGLEKREFHLFRAFLAKIKHQSEVSGYPKV